MADAGRYDGENRHRWHRPGPCCAVAVFLDYVAGMASSTTFERRFGDSEINADLQEVAHQVHEEFGDRFDPREVDECLSRVAAKFNDAKVRSFVPLLVRRYVRDELLERLAGA